MTNLIASLLPVLSAGTGIFALLSERFREADWLEIALTGLIGIGVALLFFFQRITTNRCLAWNTIIGTALLIVAQIFQLDFMIYVVCGYFLLLIILYQPEIREMFIKLSGGRSIFFKRKATIDLQRSTIDNVCQAVIELSRSKTGALIVLERRVKLDDIARSGVELDAKTSQYLIRNIFVDKAPLHDGAIIIRNGRVWSAGCILPLTPRTDVDPDLGTRHRAAIGLSEISDSVIIVVSEETGVISVAYQSDLTREYTFQSLHTFLTKTLVSPESQDLSE